MGATSGPTGVHSHQEVSVPAGVGARPPGLPVHCSTVSLSLVSTLKLSPTLQEMLASQLAKSNSQPINLFRFLAPGDLEGTPPPPHCLCREADWTAQLHWVSAVTASGLEPGIPGISRREECVWPLLGWTGTRRPWKASLETTSISIPPCWASVSLSVKWMGAGVWTPAWSRLLTNLFACPKDHGFHVPE